MVVRKAHPNETKAIQALVQLVIDEVYGGLWAAPPLPINLGDQDWTQALVAVLRDKIIGVILTQGEWIDELWVLKEHRGCGVGRYLLAEAETEIAAKGHAMSRLRVVGSNLSAIRFYGRAGWRIEREVPHNSFPVMMLEMSKSTSL